MPYHKMCLRWHLKLTSHACHTQRHLIMMLSYALSEASAVPPGDGVNEGLQHASSCSMQFFLLRGCIPPLLGMH